MNDSITRLRIVSLIEGLSYLLLVFIAMPLKYLFDQPQMVSVVGMAHGVLFVLFALALGDVLRVRRLGLQAAAIIFLWSLVPFGFLLIDWRLRELAQSRPALQS